VSFDIGQVVLDHGRTAGPHLMRPFIPAGALLLSASAGGRLVAAFAVHATAKGFHQVDYLATASLTAIDGLSSQERAHITGRGGPISRGLITGAATAIGGMLHTFPFLISNLNLALKIAYAVVVTELLAIAFIRYRFMHSALLSTIVQVIVGGGAVFAIGIWLGRIGAE
jgi:hypothetical protein